MNKAFLMGRLTRDPEIRYTNGSEPVAIARYTLAVNRRFRKDEAQSADFVSCIAFGKAGEFAEKYLCKGIQIAVVGRIQTGSYTNKEGRKVYTTDVVIEEQYFADSKNNAQDREARDNAAMQAAGYAGGQEIGDGFMSIPEGIEDEGLPFNN